MKHHIRKLKNSWASKWTNNPTFEMVTKTATEALFYIVFTILFSMTIEQFLMPKKLETAKPHSNKAYRSNAMACTCKDIDGNVVTEE